MHPDLAQQPSALSALSAVVPSGEPPEAASPPFLHHTLCLKEIAPEKNVHLSVLLYLINTFTLIELNYFNVFLNL